MYPCLQCACDPVPMMPKPSCSPNTLYAIAQLSRAVGINGYSLPSSAPFPLPSRCATRKLLTSRYARMYIASNYLFNSRHNSSLAKDQVVSPREPDPESSYSVPAHHQQYTERPFTDIVTLSLQSGNGGHGCASFLRDKFIARGPPNGGDGGRGGSIYIQAIYGETTSLHKLGRQGIIRGGDGRNGMGKNKNGERGEDIIIRVPVGTIVREIGRWDPSVILEEELKEYEQGMVNLETEEDLPGGMPVYHGSNDKWIHYPLSEEDNLASPKFQAAKYPTQHHLSSTQLLKYTHPLPVDLDLSKPTPVPIMLLPGAPGGLGNPHFITPQARAPKYATRGGKGARMKIVLELKILADVGLVGLPNAGKSSFLRAVSRRKAKVGEWAFTTLSPNIGTVHIGPINSPGVDGGPRERFTIADIPGLIADAHLNKGLGHGFLRHVERAKVLAFVVDLGRPDPTADLKALWREVKAYEEGWGDEELAEKIGRVRMGMLSEMSGNVGIDSDLPLSEGEEKLLQATATEDINRDDESKQEEPVANEDDIEDMGMNGRLGDEHIALAKPELSELHPDIAGEEEELVVWLGTRATLPKHSPSEHSFPRTKERNYTPSLTQKLNPISQRQKISLKPWFVIANKADLKDTERRFLILRSYMQGLEKDGSSITLVPVSAMRGEGVEGAIEVMKGLLAEEDRKLAEKQKRRNYNLVNSSASK